MNLDTLKTLLTRKDVFWYESPTGTGVYTQYLSIDCEELNSNSIKLTVGILSSLGLGDANAISFSFEENLNAFIDSIIKVETNLNLLRGEE